MKKLYKLYFIVMLIVSAIMVQAQNFFVRIDSLKKVLLTQNEDTGKVNTLDGISWYYFQNNIPDSSNLYADEALALANRLGFKSGIGRAYIKKAFALYGAGNLDTAVYYSNLARPILIETKDGLPLHQSYNIIAEIYYYKEIYPEALKYYLLALQVAENNNIKEGVAWTKFWIANIYFALGNDSLVLNSYKSSLAVYKELKIQINIARCYIGLGDVYYRFGSYKEALLNFREALKILEGSKEWDNYLVNEVDIKIGKIYLAESDIVLTKGEAEKFKQNILIAENFFRKAKSISETRRDSVGIAESFINLGNLFLKQNNLDSSKRYLNNALLLYQTTQLKSGIRDSYLSLSKYDSIVGNFSQAYTNYKLYIHYLSIIKNDSLVKKTVQLQSQYEYEKKDALAKSEQARKDAETKRTRNVQYIAIGIFIFVGIFLFWNNRLKQKAKTKIEKAYAELKSTQAQLIQSEKMASLGELTAGIAHEIQNPLNFVNNFSEVNKELLEELKDEARKGNIDEVKSIADDIIENSEKINHHGKRADAIVKGMLQHSRTSTGIKEPTDINAVCDEYLRLCYQGIRAKDKTFNATLKTDFDSNIGRINIIPQDIGRVILNLINNSFYAVAEKKKQQPDGYEPAVSVRTKKLDDKICIVVNDNGNGIPKKIVDKIFQPFFTTKPTGQGTGLGLSLSYDIIKAHGGEIKVETKEGDGSTFTIQLPVV